MLMEGMMGDRYVGPKGRILRIYKSGRDAGHTSLDPFHLSHHTFPHRIYLVRQSLSPMAYTAPTSARVWSAPMGGTVWRMDPRTHKQDNHGAQGYKSNQEVSELVFLFDRKTKL